MHRVCLLLVQTMQIIKPRLDTGKVKNGWLFHETELGVNVRQLLIVAQGVPITTRLASAIHDNIKSTRTCIYHGLRLPGFVHVAKTDEMVSRSRTT